MGPRCLFDPRTQGSRTLVLAQHGARLIQLRDLFVVELLHGWWAAFNQRFISTLATNDLSMAFDTETLANLAGLLAAAGQVTDSELRHPHAHHLASLSTLSSVAVELSELKGTPLTAARAHDLQQYVRDTFTEQFFAFATAMFQQAPPAKRKHGPTGQRSHLRHSA